MQSYFFAESMLDQICNNIEIAEDYKLTLKDIKGNGIQRSSLYLKKVANVRKPFETPSWRALQDFNKIRNLFVHADGVFDTSNNDALTLSKKYEGLSFSTNIITNELIISISKIFTLNVLDSIEVFFQDVHEHMMPKNKE